MSDIAWALECVGIEEFVDFMSVLTPDDIKRACYGEFRKGRPAKPLYCPIATAVTKRGQALDDWQMRGGGAGNLVHTEAAPVERFYMEWDHWRDRGVPHLEAYERAMAYAKDPELKAREFDRLVLAGV